MWILVLLLTSLSASVQGQDLVPVLDCVIYNFNTNTLLAFFGYGSSSTQEIDIPVGPNNFFFPGTLFRNQPTAFQPNLHLNVFATSFQVSAGLTQITWFLNGNTVVAKNDTSLYCSLATNCSCPAGPAGPQGPPGPRGANGINGTAFNVGSCHEVVVKNTGSVVQQMQGNVWPDKLPNDTMLCYTDPEVGCGLDAIAPCGKGEFLLTGQSECSFPLVLRASGELTQNSWKTSCLGIKIKNTFAKATAVCCTA